MPKKTGSVKKAPLRKNSYEVKPSTPLQHHPAGKATYMGMSNKEMSEIMSIIEPTVQTIQKITS